MPGNIEIKARIDDVKQITEKARSISNEEIPLEQCDTFFNAPTDCRLKLRYEKNRATEQKTAVLIAYSRPDVTGPKFSHYVLSSVPDPESMESVLAMSNGIQGKVEKQRDVFIVSRNNLKSRVHVDVVKDLGNFIEFEVIVEDDSQLSEANEFADYLSKHFGLSEVDHIAGAYWNLLQSKGGKNGK